MLQELLEPAAAVAAAGRSSITAFEWFSGTGQAAVTASVQVLMPPGDTRDIVITLLEGQGWDIEFHERANGVRTVQDAWTLAVIGADEVTRDIVLTCARIARRPRTRVLVIAADRDPQHIADALHAGADDYLVAPFYPEECLARMYNLLRRVENVQAINATEHGSRPAERGLTYDHAGRRVLDGGAGVALSPREWTALMTVIDGGGRVVSASTLAAALWGNPVHTTGIPSTISRLRAKLEAGSIQNLTIQTVRGRGYTAVTTDEQRV